MPHSGLLAAFPGDGAVSHPRGLMGANIGPVRPVRRNAALCRNLFEGLAIKVQHSDLPGSLLPASDNHVAIAGIEFNDRCAPTGCLGGHQRRAGPGKRVSDFTGLECAFIAVSRRATAA